MNLRLPKNIWRWAITLGAMLLSLPAFAHISTGATYNNILVHNWSYKFKIIYGGFYRMIPGPSAAIGEMRADYSGLEVATGNEEYRPLGDTMSDGPLGRWFLFSSKGDVIWWKDTENDEAHSSVNLADINGDGAVEMLGGTTSGNQVQAMRPENAQWAWVNPHNGHNLSTPATVKMGNNEWRVFSGSFDYTVKSFRGATGQIAWRFYTKGPIWSTAAVADLDGDSKKEVVIGSDDANLYCLDAHTGALKWKVNLGGAARASAALADLNGDGSREVIIGTPWISSGTLMALNGATGQLIWSFPTGGSIVSSPAVGDVDGDGKLDIIFGSGDGKVYGLSGDGTLKWSRDLESPIYSSPALARRTAGPRLDVYIVTFAGYLTLLQGDTGAFLDSFRAAYTSVSSPVVGDVDGDGKLEIFFQDRYGDINYNRGDHFWSVKDLGSQVPPYSKPWPMFRSNAAHTGVYEDALPDQMAKPDGEAPQIAHTPVAGPAADNEPLIIEAMITDNSEVAIAGLTFWQEGASKYYTIPMNPAGNSKYRASIPALYLQSLKTKRINYFIDATDEAGNYPPTGQFPGSLAAPNAVSVLDVTLPTATIATPRPGDAVGRQSLLSGNFRPQDVARVELAIKEKENGRFWGPSGWQENPAWLTPRTFRAVQSAYDQFYGYWQHNLSTVALVSEKLYELSARAVDTSGNIQNPIPSVSFIGDNDGPSITFQAPAEGGTYYHQLSPLGNFTDTLAGPWYLYLIIKDLDNSLIWSGSKWQNYYAYVQPKLTGSTWTLTAPAWIEGHRYEITAYGADKAYNWTTKMVRFRIGLAQESTKLPGPTTISANWAWDVLNNQIERQVNWQVTIATDVAVKYQIYVQEPGSTVFKLEQIVPSDISGFNISLPTTDGISAWYGKYGDSAGGSYRNYGLRRKPQDFPIGAYRFYVVPVDKSGIAGTPSPTAEAHFSGLIKNTSSSGWPAKIQWEGPLDSAVGDLHLTIASSTIPFDYASYLGSLRIGNFAANNITLDSSTWNTANVDFYPHNGKSLLPLQKGTTYYLQIVRKAGTPDPAFSIAPEKVTIFSPTDPPPIPPLPATSKIWSGWGWTSSDHLDRQLSWQAVADTATVKAYQVFVQAPGQTAAALEQEVPANLTSAQWLNTPAGTAVLVKSSHTYTYTLRRKAADWVPGAYKMHVVAINHQSASGQASTAVSPAFAGLSEINSVSGWPPAVFWKSPFDGQKVYAALSVMANSSGNMLGMKTVSNWSSSSVTLDKIGMAFTTATLKTNVTYYLQLVQKIHGVNEQISISAKQFPFSYSPDTAAPVSAASVQGTMGAHGYWISRASVTLSATDNLSGVEKLFYRTEPAQPWNPYTEALIFDEGSRVVEFYATDKAGNSETSQNVTVAVDLTPPAAAITALSAASVSGTAQDNLSGIAQVEIAIKDLVTQHYYNGSSFSSEEPFWIMVSTSLASWEKGLPELAVGHSYALSAKAKDRAGWVQQVPAITFLDVNAPASKIVSPAPNEYRKSLTELSGTASDIGSGVAKVEINIQRISDGHHLSQQGWTPEPAWLTVQGLGNWSLQIATAIAWPQSSYKVTSRAQDMSGNQETPLPGTIFTIDDQAPVTYAATDGSEGTNGYYKSSVRCVLKVTDSLSGVSKTYYRIIGPVSSTPSDLDPWKEYISTITFSAPGIYALEFYSSDKVGNAEEIKKLDIRIDLAAPISTILKPPANAFLTSLSELAGASQDEGSGLADTRVSLGIFSTSEAKFLFFSAGGWSPTQTWLSMGNKTDWTINTGPLQEGRYLVQTMTDDHAGNISYSTNAASFVIDQTPPQSAASYPGMVRNGWFVGQASATLSASDNLSGVESIFYRMHKEEPWIPYLGPIPLNQEGLWILERYAKDKAGNTEPVAGKKVYVDLARPKAVITTFNAQKAAGYVEDNLSGAQAVMIHVFDTNPNQFIKGTWHVINKNFKSDMDNPPLTSTQPASNMWEMEMPTLISGHTYRVDVYATDNAGWGQTETSQATFLYDVTPPVSKITAPQAEDIAQTLNQIKGTALDKESGIESVEIQLIRESDGATWTGREWKNEAAWLKANAAQEWEFNISTSVPWSTGNYRIVSRARDLHGNLEANPGSVSFTIDLDPPTTTLQAQGTKTGGFYVSPVTLSFNGVDLLAGIRETKVKINEKPWEIISGSITLNASGIFTVQFFSEDKTGNAETAKSQILKLDLEAPQLSITSPENGATVTSPGKITISGQAKDAPSGLAGLKLFLEQEAKKGRRDEESKSAAQELSIHLSSAGVWTAEAQDLKNGKTYILSLEASDKVGHTASLKSAFTHQFPKGKAKSGIKIPEEGKKIHGNAVTVMAEATSNTEAIVFQFRADGEAIWTDITSKDEKLPFSCYWNVSSLPNGKYWIRALAFDSDGLTDPDPKAIWVQVSDVNADVREDGNPEVDPNREHRKEEKIQPDKTQEVAMADGTSALIPEGAIAKEDKIMIRTLGPKEVAPKLPPAESALKSAGVFREFTLDSGEHKFHSAVTLTLPYPDENHDDIVDGTDIKVEELKPHYFDETSKEWKQLSSAKNLKKPSTKVSALGLEVVTHAGKAVEVSVNHFTLFGLFAVRVAETIANVIAYPNPVVTSQGMNAVTFDGLPSSAKLRIFTIAGRLVLEKEISEADQGKWIWDLTNDQNQAVASGAYIWAVTGRSNQSSKGKLAIVR